MTRFRAFLLVTAVLAAFLGLAATRTSYPLIVATTCTNQFIRSIAAATGTGSCATVSLTADITGTLAKGNGGTGSTGKTTFSPSYSCGGGTPTSIVTNGSAFYQQVGDVVAFVLSISMANINTCTTSLIVSGLPVTVSATGGGVLTYNTSTGVFLQGLLTASGTVLTIQTTAGLFPGVSGNFLIVNGTYLAN